MQLILIITALVSRFNEKITLSTNLIITSIEKSATGYIIETDSGSKTADLLISTIPVPQLIDYYYQKPDIISELGKQLKYNSLIIALINLKVDHANDNFVFTILIRMSFLSNNKIRFFGF